MYICEIVFQSLRRPLCPYYLVGPLDAVGCRKVSAIVPARDECGTIRSVIEALLASDLIDDVIVVDDGSTDATAAIARSCGVSVDSLPRSHGKAFALARGVRAARHEILFFCDADLTGLTPFTIARIVTPVISGDYGMFVGIRGRKLYWVNRLLHFTPVLGGERALHRSLWDCVPRTYKKNFQIEIALNFFAKRTGRRMGFTVLHGLSQIIKEKKRGLWLGLWQRLLMIRDILLVSGRLYLLLQPQMVLRRVQGRAASAANAPN